MSVVVYKHSLWDYSKNPPRCSRVFFGEIADISQKVWRNQHFFRVLQVAPEAISKFKQGNSLPSSKQIHKASKRKYSGNIMKTFRPVLSGFDHLRAFWASSDAWMSGSQVMQEFWICSVTEYLKLDRPYVYNESIMGQNVIFHNHVASVAIHEADPILQHVHWVMLNRSPIQNINVASTISNLTRYNCITVSVKLIIVWQFFKVNAWWTIVQNSTIAMRKATGTTRPTCKYLQVRAVYVLKLGKTWAKFVGPHVVSTASVRIWEHADTP